MNKGLISVIVAVYNIEEYLPRCVDSLISQSHTRLEIILVDDGSTDRSGDICDHYAERDKRIKVIHKKNGGLSDARNAGLKEAGGEYIGFVDGDDWISPLMYQSMYDACVSEAAQIAVCRYEQVGQGADNKRHTGETVSLDRLQALEIYVCGHEQYVIYNSVWSKLFHWDTIKGLQFAKGRQSEDIMFTTQAFCRMEKCVYLDTPYYYYVLDREGSIMNEKIGERRFKHEIPFWIEQSAYFEEAGLQEIADKSKYHFFRRMLFYYLDFREKKLKSYAKQLVRMLRQKKGLIRKIYKNSFVRRGDRYRMKVFLLFPGFYFRIVGVYDSFFLPLRRKLRRK